MNLLNVTKSKVTKYKFLSFPVFLLIMCKIQHDLAAVWVFICIFAQPKHKSSGLMGEGNDILRSVIDALFLTV